MENDNKERGIYEDTLKNEEIEDNVFSSEYKGQKLNKN